MMRQPTLGVRGRFILVLLGVLTPLAVLGAWIAHAGRRSTEEMLRERVEASLLEAATIAGHRWIDVRSRLLDVGEHPAVLAALAEGRDPAAALERPNVAGEAPAGPPDEGAVGEPATRAADAAALRLRRGMASLPDVAAGVEFSSADGTLLGSWRSPATSMPSADVGGTFLVEVSLFDAAGVRMGTMSVRLRLSSVLPVAYMSPGAGDWVTAVLNRAGAPLTPLPMESRLFGRIRFQWAGEDWIAARRSVGEPPLTLALAAPLTSAALPFTLAARQGVAVLVLVSGAGFLLALVLTRRITTPLERLADAADSVSRGELGRRVEESGPDEIRRLAGAFNSMTRSLQQLLRRVTQQESAAAVGEFAAELAHEVRNPLTSIRLDLERAREQMAEDAPAATLLEQALHQVERLDATVSGSLRVARSGGLPLSVVELAEPVRAAAAVARPHFEGRELQVSLPGGPLPVVGNRDALEQLVLNLLLNAATAVSEGGRAIVRAAEREGSVELAVEDDGCGIPVEGLERVFEPFYTTRREGTGLGLTIVRRVAQAHGAELHIRSEPGRGTTVSVRLQRPVTDEAAAGTTRNGSAGPADGSSSATS